MLKATFGKRRDCNQVVRNNKWWLIWRKSLHLVDGISQISSSPSTMMRIIMLSIVTSHKRSSRDPVHSGMTGTEVPNMMIRRMMLTRTSRWRAIRPSSFSFFSLVVQASYPLRLWPSSRRRSTSGKCKRKTGLIGIPPVDTLRGWPLRMQLRPLSRVRTSFCQRAP